MSENQEVATLSEDQLQKNLLIKRESWGQMGMAVYKTELELQVRAQSIINSIKIPEKSEDLEAAETQLKEIGQLATKLTEDRKAVTGKFDAVIKRLMDPEKSIEPEKLRLGNAIIKVKKDHFEAEKKKKAKADELATIQQKMTVYIAGNEEKFTKRLAEMVEKAYSFALGEGFPEGDIVDFIEARIKDMPESAFTIIKPVFVSAAEQQEAVENAINESFVVKPFKHWKDKYKADLSNMFSDYAVALHNKAEALENAKAVADQAVNQATDEAQNTIFASSMAASATVLNTVPGIKALKESYVVDMEDTFQNACKIMNAFVSYSSRTMEKLTVKKWRALSVDQMANALGKLKSEDNGFFPNGIIFKTVEKL